MVHTNTGEIKKEVVLHFCIMIISESEKTEEKEANSIDQFKKTTIK